LRRKSFHFIIFLLIFVSSGCKAPPVPSEFQEAKIQEEELWRAGATIYENQNYTLYKQRLKTAQQNLIKEKAKFGWFRDYDSLQEELRSVLAAGDKILKKIQQQKEHQSKTIANQVSLFENKINTLKSITVSINERGEARKCLARAEVLLMEVEQLSQKEKYEAVSKRLETVGLYLQRAEQVVLSMLERYTDEAQIRKWKKWADEAIAESRTKGITALVVNKLDKKLIIYKKGLPQATFDVGLGSNGLSDKLYSGDNATPEGTYKIIKKFPTTQYYKALLINYPNEEDKKQFTEAKKTGLLSPRTGIGGDVEIHGGGKDSLTKGCISLENEDMDIVFDLVEVGTPVTIVGAIETNSSIIQALKNL
jgi:lipoprotein-anchoring transpeptidase ErfK/SrfK